MGPLDQRSRSFGAWRVLAALGLGTLAVVEYAGSDTFPETLPAVHVTVALLVCGSIVLFPARPRAGVIIACAALLGEAAVSEPALPFGSGGGLLVVAYGAGHWLERRDLRWALPALAATSLARDLRSDELTGFDAAIDLVLLAGAVALGLEIRRRGQRAQDLEHDLAVAQDRVSEAVEAERTRLARELHDIVASSVSVMVVQAGTSRPLAERQSPELAEILLTIETTGREALVELRRLLGVLRGEPVSLTEPIPGLDDLERLGERMRQAGLEVALEVAQLPPTSRGLDLCVHRVVQEGLTNVLRHAPGAVVRVTVGTDGPAVVVRVVDDGARGEVRSAGGSGVGLIGLGERVGLFGGTLDHGPLGDGYELRAILPFVEAGNLRVPAR